MEKPRILLVEDEMDLGNVVRQYLEISDFEVDWVTNGRQAYDLLRSPAPTRHPPSPPPGAPAATLHLPASAAPRQSPAPNYQIVLIDVSMPEMDGFELAEKIVQLGLKLPFLFLTARNEKADRLHGLKLGADDYIIKPFDVDELVLRIRNIIKRNTGATLFTPASADPFVRREDVVFHKDSLKLLIGNKKEIVLTPREAELLDYLFRNENRILKREEILSQLWGENDYFLGRSLDVFISRLRKHLSDSDFISIDNVYGVGFVFNVKRR
jgi:DNA-binding response OmpR family regulator